jgi:hypothetical protein
MIIVFYSPILLAFENTPELIQRGNQNSILSNLLIVDKIQNTFQLNNDRSIYLLYPMFDIKNQSYTRNCKRSILKKKNDILIL